MEWINVNDRLPEDKNSMYLVIAERGKKRLPRIAKWQQPSKKFTWMVSPFKAKEITHWMPLLPIPPKED